MFEGSYVALITPMTPSGALDEVGLRQLVEWHIDEGTDGLVPVGTTGESPVLSEHEHLRVIELVVEQAAGRIRIIAGCGSNNTAEALRFHAHAFQAGADGALHVTGYYNRPSPAGIKYACSQIGMSNDLVRLPMVSLSKTAKNTIDVALGNLAVMR